MKVLLSICALLSLSLSLPAFADTRCADAWTGVTYEHRQYQGGAAPMPGMELNRIQIRVRGTLLSESIVREGEAPVLGPVNPDFSEIKVLADHQDPTGYTKDFQALLTLTRNPQNTAQVEGLEFPWSGYVICREVTRFLP